MLELIRQLLDTLLGKDSDTDTTSEMDTAIDLAPTTTRATQDRHLVACNEAQRHETSCDLLRALEELVPCRLLPFACLRMFLVLLMSMIAMLTILLIARDRDQDQDRDRERERERPQSRLLAIHLLPRVGGRFQPM